MILPTVYGRRSSVWYSGRERLRFGDEFTLGFFVESGRRLGPRLHGLTDLGEELLLSGGGAETEQAHCLR